MEPPPPPPPPPVEVPPVAWGCSQRYFSEFQSALGIALTAERLYGGALAAAAVRTVTDIKDTEAGDVALVTLHDRLAALPIRPIVTYYGEPERRTFTAGTYIEAHRRVWAALHDVADIGWNLMASTFNYSDPAPWYPGDAYVDIVGIDGYAKPDVLPYPSPAKLFDKPLAFAQAHGKPMGIFEVGVLVDTVGSTSADRVTWVNALHAWVKASPGCVMVLYWESGPPVVPRNFQIRNDPAVMTAYRAMVEELG